MITLLLHHPLMFLGGLGVAWMLFLIPGAGLFITATLKRLLELLVALVKTERGRAVLWLALVAGLVWWFRTFAGPAAFAAGRTAGITEVQTQYVRDQLAAATHARELTDAGATATATARSSIDTRTADLNDRRTTAEGYARERPPVPAVCPGTDPDLVRVAAEERARLSATDRRMRDLRSAHPVATKPAGR